ncbi:MAG: hypothetical protein ACQXXC_09220 [Methanolinea tarda]
MAQRRAQIQIQVKMVPVFGMIPSPAFSRLTILLYILLVVFPVFDPGLRKQDVIEKKIRKERGAFFGILRTPLSESISLLPDIISQNKN